MVSTLPYLANKRIGSTVLDGSGSIGGGASPCICLGHSWGVVGSHEVGVRNQVSSLGPYPSTCDKASPGQGYLGTELEGKVVQGHTGGSQHRRVGCR